MNRLSNVLPFSLLSPKLATVRGVVSRIVVPVLCMLPTLGPARLALIHLTHRFACFNFFHLNSSEKNRKLIQYCCNVLWCGDQN
jgi:hypothetical protein